MVFDGYCEWRGGRVREGWDLIKEGGMGGKPGGLRAGIDAARIMGRQGKRGGMERTLRDVIERAEGMRGGEKDKVMGDAWFMMGRYERARECYERFARLCKDNGEWRKSLSGAYHDVGACLVKGGDFKGGLKWMRDSVAEDPTSPHPWNGAGVALAGMGREGDSRRCFEKGMARSKEAMGCWVNNVAVRINGGGDDNGRDQGEEEAKGELRKVGEHGVEWLGSEKVRMGRAGFSPLNV